MYRVEHVDADAGDSVLARGGPVGPTLDHGMIASLRAGLDYSTLDTKLAPHHGTSIGTWLEVADPRLGSDYSTRHDALVGEHAPVGRPADDAPRRLESPP